MSKILLIETSSEVCSVGLIKDDYLRVIYEEKGGNIHAQKAPVFVENILKEHSIDAVAVSSGPGSYTGLRIGVSLAKGLAYGKNIPLISVSTLDAMANYIINVFPIESDAVVLPVIDARRMEVYTAAYNSKCEKITNIQPVVIDQNSFESYLPVKLYIAGNAAKKTYENINYPNKVIVEVIPSAKNMVEIAVKKFNNDEFENLAYFEPFYLKQFLATKPKKRLL